MSEATRAWVYRVGLAVLLLAVAYGLIADERQVAAWTALITALTGNILATLNTSTGSADG
jgi:hypothetical protein